jgi:hypothetical protein
LMHAVHTEGASNSKNKKGKFLRPINHFLEIRISANNHKGELQ